MAALTTAPTEPQTFVRPPARVPRVQGRIPSLDGLRALSIALVMFAHLNETRGFVSSLEIERWQLGNLGVRVFFVISGFLITTLLLEESDRTGTISLGGFYVRRFFRIFPAFYFMLAVLFVLDATGVIALHARDLVTAATYTINYHHDRAWYVGHVWSLSVEEQFYLLWPAILLVAGIQRGLGIAAAMVFIAPLLRVGLGFLPAFRPGIGETFPTVADALATGCLLAGLGPRLARSPRWRDLIEKRWWLAVIAIVVSARNPSTKVAWIFGETILNASIAVVIARVIARPDDRFGRLLNTAPMVWIGTLSYSLYLWQQPFLNRHSSGLLQSFPLNIVLAVAVAHASYFLIERPFLRLRQRIERRARPQRAGGGDGSSRSATTGK
jgi:peptidoglycan/LPS O-acetylase OafA/YrhL